MTIQTFAGLLTAPTSLLIIKATVILAFACVASASARSLSAARRHLLFLLALGACAVLVVSSPLVPAVVLHAPIFSPSVAAPTGAVIRDDASDVPPIAHRQPAPQRTNAENAGKTNFRSSLPTHPLVAIWLMGWIALAIRHAVGLVGAARLARRSYSPISNETTDELAEAAVVIGATRPVRLGYTTAVRSPITFGVLRPMVLLPIAAAHWSAQTRRAVLLHELAHVMRGDWLAQVVGRFGRDVFWFHPLAWIAFAQLREAAERAADDCVLASGMPAASYGAELLDIARRFAITLPNAVAVGMTSGGNIERRFRAMFDARRSRAVVTARHRLATVGASLLMLFPFASLQIAGTVRAIRSGSVVLQHEPDVAVALTQSRPLLHENQTARTKPHPLEIAPPIIATDGNSGAVTGVAAHPNLSGKWRPDTVAGPVVEGNVNDSTIITQSDQAISIESHGRVYDEPTHNRLPPVSFEGGAVHGLAVAGPDTTGFTSNARWYGDTLVINSRSDQGRNWQTIERLTLSADGNTIIAENLSYVGARDRFGGPKTFVLRRVIP